MIGWGGLTFCIGFVEYLVQANLHVRLSWVSRYSCNCVGKFRTRCFLFSQCFLTNHAEHFADWAMPSWYVKIAVLPPPPKKKHLYRAPLFTNIGLSLPNCSTENSYIYIVWVFTRFFLAVFLSDFHFDWDWFKGAKRHSKKKNLKFSIYFKETVSRDGWPSQKKLSIAIDSTYCASTFVCINMKRINF